MPHCNYKPTNNRTGYQDVVTGNTKEAERRYNKDLGLTLLRAVTNNEDSVAKNEVFFSVGPVSQEHGIREVDPSDPTEYRRNPLNTRKAVASSFVLSAVGVGGLYAAYQSMINRNYPSAAMFGLTGLAGMAMLPDVEVRV